MKTNTNTSSVEPRGEKGASKVSSWRSVALGSWVFAIAAFATPMFAATLGFERAVAQERSTTVDEAYGWKLEAVQGGVGVRVSAVTDGGGAQAAGVEAGDVIVAVDGAVDRDGALRRRRPPARRSGPRRGPDRCRAAGSARGPLLAIQDRMAFKCQIAPRGRACRCRGRSGWPSRTSRGSAVSGRHREDPGRGCSGRQPRGAG